MRAFHSVFAGICRRVPSKLPVSMTTLPFSLPSIHLRVLAAKWEKSPGVLKCHWQGQRPQVGDDQSIMSTYKKLLRLLPVKVKQNKTIPGQPGLAARLPLVTVEISWEKCV